MTSGIARLPEEVLLTIFLLLNAWDILQCKKVRSQVLASNDIMTTLSPQVCRYFRQLLAKSSVIDYRLQLGVAGYEDGPHIPGEARRTVPQRLELFERHLKSWKTLDWVESRVSLPDGWLYELSGGVYGSGGGRTLSFAQLPSRLRSLEARVWTYQDIGVEVKDFIHDPARDILVILEGHRPG